MYSYTGSNLTIQHARGRFHVLERDHYLKLVSGHLKKIEETNLHYVFHFDSCPVSPKPKQSGGFKIELFKDQHLGKYLVNCLRSCRDFSDLIFLECETKFTPDGKGGTIKRERINLRERKTGDLRPFLSSGFVKQHPNPTALYWELIQNIHSRIPQQVENG